MTPEQQEVVLAVLIGLGCTYTACLVLGIAAIIGGALIHWGIIKASPHYSVRRK